MAVSPTSPPPPPVDNSVCCPALNLTLAFLLLRLFMGMRLVLSGFEKMGYFVAKGTATFKEALTLKVVETGGQCAKTGFSRSVSRLAELRYSARPTLSQRLRRIDPAALRRRLPKKLNSFIDAAR